MLKALLHAAGVAHIGYALYYDLLFSHLPQYPSQMGNFASMSVFPGKWKYLTVWSMVIQLVYYTVAFINDVTGTNKLRRSFLRKIRDNLFACWVFPIGMFVSISFWILFGIDRKLVFPNPNWVNHVVQTLPILLLTVESASVPKIYPSRSFGILGNILFVVVYMSWITFVNHISGVWAYPILERLNNYQRAIFMGGCVFSILGCYFLGETFNKWCWGNGNAYAKEMQRKPDKFSSKLKIKVK